MKILVAGASGLIGREVVRRLQAAGHVVRTLSRDPARAAQLSGVEVRLADATVPGALAGVCDGIELVVSALGAPVSPSAKARRDFAAVDKRANLALVDEAVRAGVRRFVYVGVYTTADYAHADYIRAHTDVETALRGSGMSYGLVRPTGVFGSFLEFIDLARKGVVPLIGNGAALSNPVHEADVADAVITAVLAGDSVEIDVGGPDILSRRRIAELAFEAIGKRPRLLAMPVWLMRALVFLMGLVNRRTGQFLRFIILASTHPCVAPATGKQALGPYFAEKSAAKQLAKQT